VQDLMTAITLAAKAVTAATAEANATVTKVRSDRESKRVRRGRVKRQSHAH